MGEPGTVYFFTGLAGAGKTTVGGLFYRCLVSCGRSVVLWDGDQRRTQAGETAPKDYSTEARKRGGLGVLRHCKLLASSGPDVVCCMIAMYDEVRDWARENIPRYREIYLRVPMEVLYRRDQKGLYSSGAAQVVGVDLPWDEPRRPDVVIENDGSVSPEETVLRLLREFEIEDALSLC